ncbi:MAG: ABC transporter ATP-binding protein [Flavobacteriaceae bacterium]
MQDNLISVQDLKISFQNKEVIHGLNFEIRGNEVLAIVGESGSGKSITSLSMMGLLPKQARTKGEILFEGSNLLELPNKQWRKIRGAQISMIFQEPMSALNPSMKCGAQVAEVLKEHFHYKGAQLQQEVLELFEKVKLPRVVQMMNQYPHQLSGGQKQRVVIAMALACKPQLIIADEPTTALDVTVQKEILELLKTLQVSEGISIVFISHDLALVSEFADRVLVMYQGDILEKGTNKEVFLNPQHAYTKALIKSKPSLELRLKKLPTVADFLEGDFQEEIIDEGQREKNHQELYKQDPLLEITNLKTYFGQEATWYNKGHLVKAVDGVSLQIYPGESLGLVGESGCGKTTLGRSILSLDPIHSGSIKYKGKEITKLKSKELREMRKDIQMIFQDPFSSLNPRITVGQAIMEPMKVHGIAKNYKDRKQKTLAVLKRVGLSEEHFDRYPHEFSGGQRQRIGIARTIALNPKLVICDESVSALDVSVQAQVLNLLNELKEDFGFTYIFISHDLAVVKYMSDQLVVMNKGKIEEQGDADQIYKSPQKDYTEKLINSIPKGL